MDTCDKFIRTSLYELKFIHTKEYTRLVAAWFTVEIQITSLMEYSNPRIHIHKKALHKTTTKYT